MSEVFEEYERQYREISASLFKKCTSAAHFDREQKKQKVSEIKSALDDGEGLLHGVDDNISMSRKILITTMTRRMDRNKWIISSIIIVLLFVIILIMYFRLSH